MSNKDRRKDRRNRDGHHFALLPHVLVDSPAYQGLSHPARSLLIEMARQFKGTNNGQLVCSRAYLARRGWKSADVIQRAKSELIAAGFLYETFKGQRPNKASWYALTWHQLDRDQGYDTGAVEGFVRAAYLPKPVIKIKGLVPPDGTAEPFLVPPDGTGREAIVPPDGTMRGVFEGSSVPPDGHHLDIAIYTREEASKQQGMGMRGRGSLVASASQQKGRGHD